MMNRNTPPTLQKINEIQFVNPTIFALNELVNLYWMNEVLDETTRIEFHFNAGSIRSKEKVAGLVNQLLFSGTPQKSSIQINEELDSLGAFLDYEIGQEIAIVSLYCLRENASKVIDIVYDAITNVSFHEEEVKDLIREKKHQFLVASEKVNVLARRAFQKHLFANSPEYSNQIKLEDYDTMKISDFKKFHSEYYLKGLVKVVVVGNVSSVTIDHLKALSKNWLSSDTLSFLTSFENEKGHFHIEKEDSVQTAIRIGRPLFNKLHSDFIDFQITQTILGDYFGSRLMSNIREDKGYTYGIGSGVSESNATGYFIIATEVGKEFVDLTLKEIQKELKKLQEELVDESELELVKNYLLGQLLKSADGPNAMMDLFMGVQLHKLTFDYYNNVIQRVHAISSEDIRLIAQKYFNWEDLTIVTAGSSNA
jgi:zinc protease